MDTQREGEHVVQVDRFPVQPFKDKNFSLNFYRQMMRARVLDERLIKMVKSGQGHFWIGGPGEEAFSTSLGMLVDKGEGLEHDYLHLHYRNNSVVMAMGMPMVEFIRQMASKQSDIFSGGRNFSGHCAYRPWNVVPVTSTIETQFSVAPGTAMAQLTNREEGKKSGVTIVVGGDAGSAEADFATAMIWASRPGKELPLLMIVTNNGWGISTAAETQHGEKHVHERAKPFGIKTAMVDGLQADKVWAAISKALEYVRETGKPFMLECMVSRMYGHSSSSGANLVEGEACPIDIFEKKLLKSQWLDAEEIKKIRAELEEECNEAHEKVLTEELPTADSIYEYSFADKNEGGIPGRDF